MKPLCVLTCLALVGLMLIACTQDDSPGVDIDATVQAAVEATMAAQPASELSAVSVSERPYRSYPPPTGYPGCHTYGTPTPDRAHP
jgi:hypothetical protein